MQCWKGVIVSSSQLGIEPGVWDFHESLAQHTDEKAASPLAAVDVFLRLLEL